MDCRCISVQIVFWGATGVRQGQAAAEDVERASAGVGQQELEIVEKVTAVQYEICDAARAGQCAHALRISAKRMRAPKRQR